MVEKIKTETSEEREAAAKYLQEELNFRLKSLEGKPDALCQVYQVAIRALRPEFKHYVGYDCVFKNPQFASKNPGKLEECLW